MAFVRIVVGLVPYISGVVHQQKTEATTNSDG